MNDILDHTEYFKKYEHYLQGRYPTMQTALNLLVQFTDQPMIVETGCMRGFQDWGAGMSTYLFAEFVTQYGGYFHSVDIDQNNVDIAKYACQGKTAHIHHDDSLDFLSKWDKGKIDLLYLDSYDMGNTAHLARMASHHQLKEIEIAFEKLNDKAIVLLDDTNFIGMGKAGQSRAFLRQAGCVELYNYQQSLWLKY